MRWGGGGSLLLPVIDGLPLVFSLGLDGHALRSPAVALSVFFGARSYNFESPYNYALGLYASAYRDLDRDRGSLVSVGLEIDGFFLAAPVLLAWQALH